MISFTNYEETLERLERMADTMDKGIRYVLTSAGEKAVRQARAKDSGLFSGRDWTDRTGNLRSSVGYGVALDGNLVMQSSFEPVNGGSGKGGRDYLKELAAQYPYGYTLIVVAGMEYASYVADHGYDVLSSAELIAKETITELMAKFNR